MKQMRLVNNIDLASFEPARDAVEVEGMVAPGLKCVKVGNLKI